MQIMQDLIGDHHPDLALIDDKIVILFREKAVKKGGQVILGNTKKGPPLLPILSEKKYSYYFIIELAADEWQTLDNTQKQALVDHHLYSMKVEEDEKSGGVKCSIKPYDFAGYREEFERWGMWRPMPDETVSAVEKMFTPSSTPTPKTRKGGKKAPPRANQIAPEDILDPEAAN